MADEELDDTDDWVSTTTAYRELGVKRYELYRLINAGELPAYKISRWIRLRRADLDQYLGRSA